jgi:hypothetical protein
MLLLRLGRVRSTHLPAAGAWLKLDGGTGLTYCWNADERGSTHWSGRANLFSPC